MRDRTRQVERRLLRALRGIAFRLAKDGKPIPDAPPSLRKTREAWLVVKPKTVQRLTGGHGGRSVRMFMDVVTHCLRRELVMHVGQSVRVETYAVPLTGAVEVCAQWEMTGRAS